MKARVFFHGKCFDGTASAALFSRFYRERIRPDVDFQFTGLVHRAGADRYELYAMRSFALSVWEWLIDAALEFGYDIAA